MSSVVHLWNPIGFPGLHTDEGHYLRRTMEVLNGAGPQETLSDYEMPYDHPYFGQLFLAAVYYLIGFPENLQIDPSNVESIGMLYSIPRTVMGVLGVIDTLLVYCIANRRYNQNIAFISSLFFAVMPFTWVIRRIYLDNILLPFLLSSIYFALCIRNPAIRKNESESGKRNFFLGQNIQYVPLVLSGILLGLALFTKAPAFTMMPLVGSLVFYNSKKRFKSLGIWLIPVILIPLLWPLYSFATDHIDEWYHGIYTQTHRHSREGIFDSFRDFFVIDPLLSSVGLIGIIYAMVKRDIFIMLWLIPFFLFSYFIGWFIYFQLALVLPAVCIGAAIVISDLPRRFGNHYLKNMLPLSLTAIITVIGLVSSLLIVSLNVNWNHIEAYAKIFDIVSDERKNNNSTLENKKPLLIAHRIYLWIPNYVLHENIDTTQWSTKSPINNTAILEGDLIKNNTERKIIVVENDGISRISKNISLNVVYNKTGNIYNNSYDTNQYPYTSLDKKYSFQTGTRIIIKSN